MCASSTRTVACTGCGVLKKISLTTAGGDGDYDHGTIIITISRNKITNRQTHPEPRVRSEAISKRGIKF